MKLDPLDQRIRIERPVADESLNGAGSGDWQPFAEVWANIRDSLPSRGERMADGINVSTRQARVRIRYRRDITAAMRVLIGHYERDGQGALVWVTERTAQITTEAAEIMGRQRVEFMIEDYSIAGGGA